MLTVLAPESHSQPSDLESDALPLSHEATALRSERHILQCHSLGGHEQFLCIYSAPIRWLGTQTGLGITASALLTPGQDSIWCFVSPKCELEAAARLRLVGWLVGGLVGWLIGWGKVCRPVATVLSS